MSFETVGATLGEWVDGVEEATLRAGERFAKDGQARFLHNVGINTPVETGLLRDSYRASGIEYGAGAYRTGSGVSFAIYSWTGRVYTEVEYAPYVEYGTGLWGPEHKKYEIKPRNPGGVLAFAPYLKGPAGGVVMDVHGGVSKTGKVVVRYVMHPGSPGAAMFRIGAVITEAEAEEWGQEAARQWQRDSDDPGLLRVSADVGFAGAFD